VKTHFYLRKTFLTVLLFVGVLTIGIQMWHEAESRDVKGVILDLGVVLLLGSYLVLRQLKVRREEKELTSALLGSYQEVQGVANLLAGTIEQHSARLAASHDDAFAKLNAELLSSDPAAFLKGFQQISLFVEFLLEQLGQEGCLGLPVCVNVRRLQDCHTLTQAKEIRVDTYSEWLERFVAMIAQNSERISAPLSQEILTIKQQIAFFLKDLAEWQAKASQESSVQYSNLLAEFSGHAEDVSRLAATIQSHNATFRDSLGGVERQFVGIGNSTEEIHEISEKVRMLSLNAAIEAARAGEAGKGFKVISDEIKKLSLSTQTIVKTISGEILSMKKALSVVTGRFDDETSRIAQDLAGLQEGLKKYDSRLGNYQNEFEKIVGLITRTSGDINTHIDALAPIFQLQDMTVQEVRHIAQVLEKFRALAQTVQTQAENRKALLELALTVATTDSELALVQELAQRWGVALAKETPKDTRIELF
jgi:methyl-accepting chemotaxis protein